MDVLLKGQTLGIGRCCDAWVVISSAVLVRLLVRKHGWIANWMYMLMDISYTTNGQAKGTIWGRKLFDWSEIGRRRTNAKTNGWILMEEKYLCASNWIPLLRMDE